MMPRTLWFGLALVVIAGCREPASAAPVSPLPHDTQGANVPQTLDIARHFTGPELALARAAASGDADKVGTLVREQRADPNAI